MIKTELLNLLKIEHKELNEYIRKAGEKFPSVLSKMTVINADYNKEECSEILKAANANPLMLIYIEENCKEKTLSPDGYKIFGTEAFIEKWNNKHNIKCCNTCNACCGVKREGSSISEPFCKIYNRFLSNMKAKVYEDYCSSWIYNNYDKPRIWLKQNAPNNINQFGEIGFVNGLNIKDFKDRKKNEPINILGEIGF